MAVDGSIERRCAQAVSPAVQELERGLRETWDLHGATGAAAFVNSVLSHLENLLHERTPLVMEWKLVMPEARVERLRALRRPTPPPGPPQRSPRDDAEPDVAARRAGAAAKLILGPAEELLAGQAIARAGHAASLGATLMVMSGVPFGIGLVALLGRLVGMGLEAFGKGEGPGDRESFLDLVVDACNNVLAQTTVPWRVGRQPLAAVPDGAAAQESGATGEDEDREAWFDASVHDGWIAPEEPEWRGEPDDEGSPPSASDRLIHLGYLISLLLDWDEQAVRELVAALNVAEQYRLEIRPDPIGGFVVDRASPR